MSKKEVMMLTLVTLKLSEIQDIIRLGRVAPWQRTQLEYVETFVQEPQSKMQSTPNKYED